ncbi:ABC transporter permease [bacterium]|nr:MAG: ABC transporter permease [bacterium]
MATSISIFPGVYELKRRKYSASLFWSLLFILPIILIITYFSLFINGLASLVLSLLLLVLSPAELNKIFNFEIVEYWAASVFVIGWVLAVWIIHRRQLKRAWEKINDTARSQWQLAWTEIKTNRLVIFFIIVLASMYAVAFLCPWLVPRDPNAQQDITVTKYAAPLQSIAYLKLRTPGRSILPFREGEGASFTVINKFIAVQNLLLNREPSVVYISSFQKRGEEIEYVQGIQKKVISVSELIGENEKDFAENRMFLLGSDKYGRDIFSRLLYGSRISLSIGFLAMAIAVTLGTIIGALAGYFGKKTDAVLMRWVDLMLAFPNLFLILMIVALFGNSIFLIVVILGLTGWMGVSRIVRGQFLALREMEYIQAAHALGFSHSRIIFKHLIPNAFAPVIVAATLRLGGIILVEAGLSFLGVGVQPPTASWGNMVAEGRDMLIHGWWISTFPGLAIVLTVICFNVIGDGLRDALDPRLRT